MKLFFRNKKSPKTPGPPTPDTMNTTPTDEDDGTTHPVFHAIPRDSPFIMNNASSAKKVNVTLFSGDDDTPEPGNPKHGTYVDMDINGILTSLMEKVGSLEKFKTDFESLGDIDTVKEKLGEVESLKAKAQEYDELKANVESLGDIDTVKEKLGEVESLKTNVDNLTDKLGGWQKQASDLATEKARLAGKVDRLETLVLGTMKTHLANLRASRTNETFDAVARTRYMNEKIDMMTLAIANYERNEG